MNYCKRRVQPRHKVKVIICDVCTRNRCEQEIPELQVHGCNCASKTQYVPPSSKIEEDGLDIPKKNEKARLNDVR